MSMKAYAGTGLEPEIEVTNHAFKVTLPNRNIPVDADTVNSNASLTTEDRILNLINSSGYIVRSDVDKLLNVSQSTANRILKRMVEEGLISRDGSGKNTKYMKNQLPYHFSSSFSAKPK